MAKAEMTVNLKFNPILPQYRYRKGWFNKCVLQELIAIEPWQISDDPPPWAKTRYEWRDVKYSEVTDDANKPSNVKCTYATLAVTRGLRHLAAECDCQDCRAVLGVTS